MRDFPTARARTTGVRHARDAGDVNDDIRSAVARDGCALFRIGLTLFDIPKP